MKTVSLLMLIFLMPPGVYGGEVRNSYIWYCPRCYYRYDRHQTIDEIIENQVPEKPSYNSRNCADAHGSTYCYWVLRKDTTKVNVDQITEYRERKRVKGINEDFKKTNNKSSYQIIQETRGREYIEPQLTITNEATEKVKDFNTDLFAPAAPFEVLKK